MKLKELSVLLTGSSARGWRRNSFIGGTLEVGIRKQMLICQVASLTWVVGDARGTLSILLV